MLFPSLDSASREFNPKQIHNEMELSVMEAVTFQLALAWKVFSKIHRKKKGKRRKHCIHIAVLSRMFQCPAGQGAQVPLACQLSGMSRGEGF